MNISRAPHKNFLKQYLTIGLIATLLLSLVPLPAGAATVSYLAEFWKPTSTTGTPIFPATQPIHRRTYDSLTINWEGGSPHNDLGTDHYMGRFTKTEDFAAGVYRFTVRADDGIRVYIDGVKIPQLDRWFDQSAPTVSVDRYVSAGSHTIKVEYYERTGNARIHFTYAPVADAGRSLWVWEDKHATNTAATGYLRTKLLDFAVSRRIDRLYFNSESLVQYNRPLLNEFITAASNRGIEVELLVGDADWAYASKHHVALNLLNQAKEYAAGVTVKPAGIHYDVEPHLLPEWKSDATKADIANQYIDMLETLRSNKGSLRLSADYALPQTSALLTRGTTTKEVSKWVIDKVDRGVFMDYRDFATNGTDGIIDHAFESVQYAANAGKPVTLGVETLCLQYSAPSDEKISFCEEGNAVLEQELGKVATQFRTSGGFGGFAIHDYKGYASLKP